MDTGGAGFSSEHLALLINAAFDNSDQRSKLETYWLNHEDAIVTYLEKNDRERSTLLDLFESYLGKVRPAENIWGRDIMHADPLLLRRLNCAYGIWWILANNSRRCYIRGDSKRWENDRGWLIHEKPLLEGHRWNVKARLDHTFGKLGIEKRIELFEQGARAAAAGRTKHCKNLARYLRAQAIHLKADLKARDRRLPMFQRLAEAKELYRIAKDLAKGSGQESLIGFRESICDLRCATVQLDIEPALKSHGEAMVCAARFPKPDNLFSRPNPWTSLKDFENERLFIWVLQLLKEKKQDGLEQSISLMEQLVEGCSGGVRRSHLEIRLFFLRGTRAAQDGNVVQAQIEIRNLSNSLKTAVSRKNDQDLLAILSRGVSERNASKLIEEALWLFPFDSQGKGGQLGEPAFFYGLPQWLLELGYSPQSECNVLFVLWYSRVLFDYCWSILEKRLEEAGEIAPARPAFWKASLPELAQLVVLLMSKLEWEGAQGKALSDLCTWLIENPGWNGLKPNEYIELFAGASDKLVFPLVMVCNRISVDQQTKVVLTRLDGRGQAYRYDESAIDQRTRNAPNDRAYVKAKFRRVIQAPKEAGRPVYLYAAPNCPRFLRTCLIIEGQSDKEFFESLFDRIEPGWRFLRSDGIPPMPTIEVRQARGASELAKAYRQAREEAQFHVSISGREVERIVVVVDGDHEHLLTSDVWLRRAHHKFVLRPDLERAVPSAFVETLSLTAGVGFDQGDVEEMTSQMGLAPHRFEEEIFVQWGVRIKDPSFARNLAKNVPKDGEGGKQIWNACYRTLSLAYGIELVN
jgi:hypothetical protein